MHGTSVTVVLVGSYTSSRPYVLHEIAESIEDGKGILAVDINKIKNSLGQHSARGANPLSKFSVETKNIFGFSEKVCASDFYSQYDWEDDDGRRNIGDWIENAARQAGR